MANSRADLTPSSSLPIAYFALSHLSLAAGLLVLVVQPALPGGFFYHPKMMALVHVVTLTWLTGSIFGAFYIVGPLVLRLPMPVRAADWTAFGAFLVGVLGMIPHFWMGEYVGMLWGAYPITGAAAWVAARAWRGLPAAPVPWPIKLHVGLAFANFLAAATLGILIGLDRTRGGFGFAPLAAAYAHAHLAAVGWVTLMVVGIAYRLIPMMLPAAMPEGGRLARSAIFLEAGLAVVVWALLAQSPWLPAGAVLITAGLGSFVVEIRRALRHRQPRPPTLPPRDWSTWQTHGALLWLIVAVGLGLVLSVGGGAASVPLMWLYGVAGLVGFLAQIVAGIQGRLVPLYAWYRAMARRGGAPPARSAHSLPSVPLARFTFLTWSGGVPLLAWGLAAQQPAVISLGAVLLLCGVAAGGAHLLHMLRGAVAGSRSG